MANVRQATLMTILKRSNLLHPPQLALEFFNVGKDLGASIAAGFSLGFREAGKLLVNEFRFCEGVEETRKEGAFLRGYLCGGSVVGDGTVADSPDVLGTVDNEVFVYCETAAGVLLRGDLGHEVFDDGAEGVAGGPDEETVGDHFFFFGAVWFRVFCFYGFVGDVLDHCLGADGDAFFLKGLFRVVDELLGK